MKLMVVDDHDVMRKIICELLARPGVEIRECVTGEQAMQSARAFQPDWIIMDVNLPGVTGFAATEIIRTEIPSVRVVIVSAGDRNYLREQALTSGAEHFLAKHNLVELPQMVYGDEEPPQPPVA
jgi:two-component system cell cycle response regulator DivK